MDEATQTTQKIDVEQVISDILATIEREREREIIARRFGLFDRKETLEQIGELLGITRERVRQLEKAIITRLKASAAKDLPHVKVVEAVLLQHLEEMGNIARVSEITTKIGQEGSKLDQARVSFLARLAPNIAVIDENDHFYHAIGNARLHTEKQIREQVGKVVEAIKSIGQPTSIAAIREAAGLAHESQAKALAKTSKQVATLNDRWGLVKWPMVNPKNIRDKIYVILFENGKPMHFSEIADSIKSSSFKRNTVTTQAIHNELIKDPRFVLIGRGIYALKDWGYKQGTVADVIADVLKKEGGPLQRDEIVKRVLKNRQVKETTILLNLQGKSQFKRVAKATYALDEQK